MNYFKDTLFLLFKKAKTIQDKKYKAAFWYGFRNPFRKISDKELEHFLKNVKL